MGTASINTACSSPYPFPTGEEAPTPPGPFLSSPMVRLVLILLAMVFAVACGSDDWAGGVILVEHEACIDEEGCVFHEGRIIKNQLLSHTNRSDVAQDVAIKAENQGKCLFSVKWQISGDPELRDFVVVGQGETDSASAQIPPGKQAIFFWSCFSVQSAECRGEVDIRIAQPAAASG